MFIDDIDVMCTNAIGDDPHLGEMTTAMGKDFWQYSGGDSRRPDRVRYTFGFFFSAYNSRGGLFWAYDWGNGFDTSRGSNWFLAWHTPFGVISSPAYECLREALDDRRYVETLKRMAADHQTEIQRVPGRPGQGRDLRADRGAAGTMSTTSSPSRATWTPRMRCASG